MSAFRLMASTSMLTLCFGIVTNKILAIVGGPSAIATLNVYRNMSGFFIALVSLGMTNVVVQRLSTSRDNSDLQRNLAALLRLVLAQIALIVLTAAFLAPLVERWLFGTSGERTTGVRVALFFVVGVFAMQVSVEVLNGLTAVRQTARVSLITSFLTMVTAYPLIHMGQVGLGMILGLTCFVGTGLALKSISSLVPFRARSLLDRSQFEWRNLPLSFAVAIRGIACTGVLLVVQAIIARNFGTKSLGIYTSASMLESNAIMLLASFMRPFYLPSLGKFEDDGSKHAFVNRTLELLIVIALPGIVALVLLSPLVLSLLFSKQFAVGSEYLSILGVSMIAQVFLYTLGFYFLHRGAFRIQMWIDVAWAVLLTVGALSCALLHAQIETVAWVYTASQCVYAVIYVVVGLRLYGSDLISKRNLMLGGLAILWLTVLCVFSRLGLVARLAFGLTTLFASALLAIGLIRSDRLLRGLEQKA